MNKDIIRNYIITSYFVIIGFLISSWGSLFYYKSDVLVSVQDLAKNECAYFGNGSIYRVLNVKSIIDIHNGYMQFRNTLDYDIVKTISTKEEVDAVVHYLQPLGLYAGNDGNIIYYIEYLCYYDVINILDKTCDEYANLRNYCLENMFARQEYYDAFLEQMSGIESSWNVIDSMYKVLLIYIILSGVFMAKDYFENNTHKVKNRIIE